jgi:hypothetical protein
MTANKKTLGIAPNQISTQIDWLIPFVRNDRAIDFPSVMTCFNLSQKICKPSSKLHPPTELSTPHTTPVIIGTPTKITVQEVVAKTPHIPSMSASEHKSQLSVIPEKGLKKRVWKSTQHTLHHFLTPTTRPNNGRQDTQVPVNDTFGHTPPVLDTNTTFCLVL